MAVIPLPAFASPPSAAPLSPPVAPSSPPTIPTAQPVVPASSFSATAESQQANPYHAPGVADTKNAAIFRRAPFRPTVMNVGEVFNQAWDIYRREFGMCFLGTFIFYLVAAACIGVLIAVHLAIEGTTDQQLKLVLGIASAGMQLVLQIVLMWLNVGLVSYFLCVVRGNKPGLTMLFKGGEFLLRLIGASLLLSLGMIGVAIVVFVPVVLIGPLWFLAAMPIIFALSMWAGLAFSQFVYMIVDRDTGAIDSLTLSTQVTRGNKLRLILLGLMGSVMSLLGGLACGIGILFVMPLIFLMATVAFLQMTGQQATP